MSWIHVQKSDAHPRNYFTWKLERPKPALPSSYFWTWDHSTNWVLDDPGLQNTGCYNKYYKQPETYLEDYRRLADLAAGIGVKGIVIWGFLRDSHGGIEYAKRIASYAASKDVAIMPGFGTTWYGGAYYEGDSPYSLQTFLKHHPDAYLLNKEGQPEEFSGEYGACPAHPAYHDWLRESLEWLYREFEIGGINLENGDMLVDYHPLTQAARRNWPADDPEPFFFQGLSYKQSLDMLADKLKTSLVTYATYTGFGYTDELIQDQGMGKKPPAMFNILPEDSICQWTLTGMISSPPMPLIAYLDDGAPAEVIGNNPNWPADLRPVSKRSVGMIHHGTGFGPAGRYECIVSSIKEQCLRAYRAGLEGASISGEVSGRYIPWALNYLAFSHFIHWPEDSLREFGRKTLGQVLGSEAAGESYAVILAHWEAGTLTEDLKKLSDPANQGYPLITAGSRLESTEEYQRFLFWQWLHTVATNDSKDQRISSALPF